MRSILSPVNFFSLDKSSCIVKKKKLILTFKNIFSIEENRNFAANAVRLLIPPLHWTFANEQAKEKIKQERNQKDPASQSSHITPANTKPRNKRRPKDLYFSTHLTKSDKNAQRSEEVLFSELTKQVSIWVLSQTNA